MRNELKKINDLSGLAHSLSLIKRNFIEKVATSSHIEDYDEKDSIEHELNKMHDLKENEKNEDVPEISDVFKEKTLDKCIEFFNAIIISQMQLLCRAPTFQIMLRDAVDAANDNEDDENEYHTIEKITPHEVEQQLPVDIESKF